MLASTDGTNFSEISRDILGPAPREHVFVLSAPVQASYVRLHLENPTGLESGFEAALAEFKVFTTPGVTPFGARPPNIAAPTLGGHIVWISWPNDPTRIQSMLTEEAEGQSDAPALAEPIEWVIGFQHQRAAHLTRLEWQENPTSSVGRRLPQQVAVAASVEGPNGPWIPIADWPLHRDADGLAVLELDTPVWARYLRFSMPSDDEGTRWQLAETLRVFEQIHDKNYRSILAEWGHYRSEAFYETQLPGTVKLAAGAQGGGTERSRARALSNSEVVAGRAEAGVRDEWYRVEAPAGLDRLELRFGGSGRSRLLPLLEDSNGNSIALQEADDAAGQRMFYAQVTAGGEVWLKVSEARRSIMLVWDNSASVSEYHDGMYTAMTRLADDIKPGFEVVNLMPLGEEGVAPLMKNWSSNPVDIKAAIGGYDRSASSSNSETTLLAAMKLLAERPGNRAIVLLTDAYSDGGALNSKLWQRFGEVRPRIFALELQLESRIDAVSNYQDLMQNWAAVNHGDYRVFRSQADLDHAFERAACLMRSPADYSVSWQHAPGKGNLQVVWESGKAMAGAAMELVLDASGSMRSSKALVAGKLKMEVAREVMQEIIQTLPDDTQVGLRIYGHRVREGTAGDCEDSELVAPVATMNRGLLSAAITNVKALGTTPIAYSIGQACGDLADVEGPKLLVVITDGKEECKGDPEAAVAACRDAMPDLRVDIVGFALADEQDKKDMERAAERGGGRFFDAQDRSALSSAIEESLAMPFDVFDSRDTSIAAGLTGAQGQKLYEGNYTVAVHTASGDVTVRDVAIREEKTTTVYLSREGDGIRFRTEEAK
ncbi:MAG: VWA domain-containing protein [Gammaproteobacteria bacterium]|nr:VWA domain-containing protein [Gammaproteobacteria bacterium]